MADRKGKKEEPKYIDGPSIVKAEFDEMKERYGPGIQNAVSLGGSRVPESMKGVEIAPEAAASAPNQHSTQEIDACMKTREELGQFKKVVADVNRTIDIILRRRGAVAENKDDNEKERLQKFVTKSETELENGLKVLVDMKSCFAGDFEEKHETIDYIVKTLSNKDLTREQLQEYNLEIRKATSKVFNEQKKLLEQIKQLKKQLA